ncbi:TPA_asm: P3 [Mango betacytorhabdovirus 1]|nr:TPA_asm: P3 [Mango betacytorhabdovirus 1]
MSHAIRTHDIQDITPSVRIQDKMKLIIFPNTWVRLSGIKLSYSPCINDANGEIEVKLYDNRYFFETEKLRATYRFPLKRIQNISIRPNTSLYEDFSVSPWGVSVEVINHNLEFNVVVGKMKVVQNFTISGRYLPPKEAVTYAHPPLQEVTNTQDECEPSCPLLIPIN